MLAWSRDSEEEPESVNVGAGPSTANETYEISGSIAAALFEDAELEVDTEIEIDGSDTLHLEIPGWNIFNRHDLRRYSILGPCKRNINDCERMFPSRPFIPSNHF